MTSSTGRSAWRDNLAELKKPLSREAVRLEASRCLYCHDAPCIKACPTSIDVPRFIRQLASCDPLGAGKTILEANPLGHSCARVCPVPVLCEGACVYAAWNDAPIRIAGLQRYATDAVHADDELPFGPGPESGLSVAVVGAGPAGVSCATRGPTWLYRRPQARVAAIRDQHGAAPLRLAMLATLDAQLRQSVIGLAEVAVQARQGAITDLRMLRATLAALWTSA